MMSRTLNVVEEDLMQVGNFAKKVAVNSLGVYAVSMLPDFTNNNTGLVQRNLMRGFAWYLSDEVANELATGTSNFRNFASADTMGAGLVNAVNDTFFYGVASGVVENTRIDIPVVNTIQSVVGNPTVSENLGLGLLLTTTQMVGQHLERAGWDALTNITRKVGLSA